MKNTKIITSEFVSYGHPDKVADQISDAILDEYISKDVNVRAGIETLIKDNVVVIGGEVKSWADVDVVNIAKDVVAKIGYPQSHNLDYDNIKVVDLLGTQSVEISRGVDKCGCEDIGAGDQGFVVGYASNETDVYLPLGVYIARQLCQSVTRLDNIGPDVKTQVSVGYGDKKPKIKSIVVSAMHSENVTVESVRKTIKDMLMTNDYFGNTVMDKAIYDEFIKDKEFDLFINPNGTWNVGGPISDCGVTGRKIVVDQYGGYSNVGGGAYSGKDMSKVDRSAAYMSRYLAKNIVAAGLADSAKVELSYIIGQPNPCAINIVLENPIKTEKISSLSEQIKKFILKKVDLSPRGIIKRFFTDGIKPIFFNTASNGHYGYNYDDKNYPWEKMDLVDELREYIEETEINMM